MSSPSTETKERRSTPDPLRGFDVEVDARDPPPDIQELIQSEVSDPSHGFFGPGTVMWRVNQENTIFLAGTAAVLLQVAHPMVSAAGVQHSDYDEDLVGRFERTFDIVDTIVFGDKDTAVEAAMIVRRIHDEVVGELPGDAGRFREGDAYYANRPDLLYWVHATLIDQSMAGYEAYVGSLSGEERQTYYEESQVFGRLMGVPADMYPETVEEFYRDYRGLIRRNVAVGETGEEVIDGFYGQLGLVAPFARFLAGGTMPREARDELLGWGPVRQRLFDVYACCVRRVPLGLLPARVRYREKYRLFGLELED